MEDIFVLGLFGMLERIDIPNKNVIDTLIVICFPFGQLSFWPQPARCNWSYYVSLLGFITWRGGLRVSSWDILPSKLQENSCSFPPSQESTLWPANDGAGGVMRWRPYQPGPPLPQLLDSLTPPLQTTQLWKWTPLASVRAPQDRCSFPAAPGRCTGRRRWQLRSSRPNPCCSPINR